MGHAIRDAMGRTLGRNRRWGLVRALDRLCQGVHRAVENANPDLRTNGELRVLEVMGRHGARVLMDVGANHGEWTLAAHRVCGEATIHSFEIVPGTFEHLRKAAAGKDRIVANDFGLDEREGTTELKFIAGRDTRTTAYQMLVNRPYEVIAGRTKTGDDYVTGRGIAPVDMLKMDVEGMEARVLRGLGRTLAAGAIRCIQFEYGLVNVSAGVLLRDFYAMLEPKGYRIGKIYPTFVEFREYGPADEDFIGPNYLAVRREETAMIEAMAG
ncbi:MAG: FkbM family methyltransferase [Phycisphaerales bacterium]